MTQFRENYNHYDPIILAKLQHVELEMLQELDRVCRKYEIEYFATFGTAIGAVRHQGFIPWDDDVDVGMTRDNFEKLRRVPREEWRENIELVSPDDDYIPSYHRSVWPKLYKSHTIYEQRGFNKMFRLRDPNCKTPIWLDIFVFDAVDDPQTVKNQARKLFALGRRYFYSRGRAIIPSRPPVSCVLRCLLKKTIYRIARIVPLDRWIYRYFRRVVAKTPGEYLTVYATLVLNTSIVSCEKRENMFPCERVPCETFTIPLAKNCRDSLARIYGDYNVEPPEEERYNHPPTELDFGDGQGNVVAN